MNALSRHLVEDWRYFMRWWSVRMTLIGGLLGSLFAIMPTLPPEVQAVIPIKYRVAVLAIWSLATVATRAIQQRKPGGQ